MADKQTGRISDTWDRLLPLPRGERNRELVQSPSTAKCRLLVANFQLALLTSNSLQFIPSPNTTPSLAPIPISPLSAIPTLALALLRSDTLPTLPWPRLPPPPSCSWPSLLVSRPWPRPPQPPAPHLFAFLRVLRSRLPASART